ncbi:hypothetical protein F4810DRAFT_668824 [Camillea tinctor]|nr:hypothetical protein F4810DRAFT_668824 [Camillea tinctor]
MFSFLQQIGGLVRRKDKSKQEEAADYRIRWPTQDTLYESWASEDHPEDYPEKKSSMRLKALEAVKLRLLWLETKLEQWHDEAEQRMQLIEARRQKRYCISSLSEAHNAHMYFEVTKAKRPGTSKHPYDTGADTRAGSDTDGDTESLLASKEEHQEDEVQSNGIQGEQEKRKRWWWH